MSRGMVLQGVFAGGRPRLPGVQGVAQPRGHAFELPSSVKLAGPGRGQRLPGPVRQKMETALGGDFSDVRIHVGTEAPSIGALAFTHGSDIYFAPGLYSPESIHGQRLLGHELTHVLQQRAGRVRNPFGSGVAVVQDPGMEAEADRMGMMAAAQPMMPESAAQQKPVAAGPSGLAPHVQAAIARPGAGAPLQQKPGGGRPVAAHVQAAIGRTGAGVQTKAEPGQPAAQAKGGGYRLVVGAYLHRQGPGDKALPEDLAGHTFVSIQGPGGRGETWGFSPSDRSYDPNRELGQLRAGVQGKIHSDGKAFSKPGVRTRSYEISREQAEAAAAKVAEYRRENPSFSLQQRQCASFALDVARAAGVDALPGAKVRKPRDVYGKL